MFKKIRIKFKVACPPLSFNPESVLKGGKGKVKDSYGNDIGGYSPLNLYLP